MRRTALMAVAGALAGFVSVFVIGFAGGFPGTVSNDIIPHCIWLGAITGAIIGTQGGKGDPSK